MSTWPHRYEIESVRTAQGRLDRYQAGLDWGPYDIALLRLTADVKFIPQQIAPVRSTWLNIIYLNYLSHYCLVCAGVPGPCQQGAPDPGVCLRVRIIRLRRARGQD